MRIFLTRLFFLLLAISFLAVGCHKVIPPMPADLPSIPPESLVKIGIGDQLEIKFRYWPELNEIQNVRPDGKITLQMVNAVQAAGLTPEELDNKLVELFQKDLKNPIITVFVRTWASNRIYVGGEVKTPGIINITTNLSVLDAVLAAGGFVNLSANPSQAILIRQVDGKRFVRDVDLKVALKDQNVSPTIMGPGDILYVPRTKIDRVDQFVDQYITKLIPGPVLVLLNGRNGGVGIGF